MPNDQIQQGTAGRFGILKQSAFNTPQSTDTSFYYTAFTNCGFGPVEAQGSLPPEAGNTKALPRGVFKAGVHATIYQKHYINRLFLISGEIYFQANLF